MTSLSCFSSFLMLMIFLITVVKMHIPILYIKHRLCSCPKLYAVSEYIHEAAVCFCSDPTYSPN